MEKIGGKKRNEERDIQNRNGRREKEGEKRGRKKEMLN